MVTDEPMSDECIKDAMVGGLEKMFKPLNGKPVIPFPRPAPQNIEPREEKLSVGAGMNESEPCEPCSASGAVGVNHDTCPACRGHGKRYIYRPAVNVMHIPTVIVPCGCGRVYNATAPEAVKEFQRTGMTQPIDCGCGRRVIGQRRLVLV